MGQQQMQPQQQQMQQMQQQQMQQQQMHMQPVVFQQGMQPQGMPQGGMTMSAGGGCQGGPQGSMGAMPKFGAQMVPVMMPAGHFATQGGFVPQQAMQGQTGNIGGGAGGPQKGQTVPQGQMPQG